MPDGDNTERTPRERQLAGLRKPWAPGECGNKGGRPQIIRDVAAAAREHTQAAIKTLADALTAKKAPWSAKIKAAEVLLDRGYGCSPRTVNLAGNISTMTYEQLQRALALQLIGIAAGRFDDGGSGDSARALPSPDQDIVGTVVQ